MLFNSFTFLFAFFPVTYLVFWSLRSTSARYVWLTITGYVFYAHWNPWFCLLMAFSTLVSYAAGIGMLKYQTPRARWLCLVIPITVDLLLLGFFKYAYFFLSNAQALFNWLGIGILLPTEMTLGPDWSFKFSDIILPVGISFYTFHTISYIIDAYRGTITPTRNFFEFSTYVSLFSQLVAGPIVRFRQIEADLENLGRADRTRWMALGVSFFLLGLLEKVVIADTIAAFIDPALKAYDRLSTAGVWMAVLGYTFQLYFDFSGYSSMAIGLGFLFGIRIPINFLSPYQATDPSDFWKRWHISLSTCLRDYLYIPLGGNRHGTFLTYRNLLLTMLIGGLWHGANWTFIVWGAYHGLLLCLYRAAAPAWDALPRLLRQLLMFLLVVIGWVFFRSDNLSMAGVLLERMFVLTPGIEVMKPAIFIGVLGIAALWAMTGPSVVEMHEGYQWKRRYVVPYALIFGVSLALIASGRNSPFLYFQF